MQLELLENCDFNFESLKETDYDGFLMLMTTILDADVRLFFKLIES